MSGNPNELALIVSKVQHVEEPYLRNLLALKKIKIAKEPVDKAHYDALKKVEMCETEVSDLNSWSLRWFESKVTCSLQANKDRSAEELKKANILAANTEEKVQEAQSEVNDVEDQNKQYETDYRKLVKSREDLTLLFDETYKGYSYDFKGLKEIEACKEEYLTKSENIEKLKSVKEKIKNADLSILEAILELRASHIKETLIGESKVFFPETAYECLIQAREEYPSLPGFKSPSEYVNDPDDIGAYYSPQQKYLWDVRKELAKLITWCDDEGIRMMEEETDVEIELGRKTDKYNMERLHTPQH